MLSQPQQAYFETFGFIVMRGLFSADEMAAIGRDFDDVLAQDRQGQPFDGASRQAVLGFIEKRPLLSSLAEDDRIYEPIEQLLGQGFVWIGSDGNLYVGDTGWHPDGSNLGYGRIKVAFYLDRVRADSGCLRVIPGSQREPLHSALAPLREQRNEAGLTGTAFGVAQREIPCYPLGSDPGDVVFFNQNTWHASFGGQTGRRMFTLNFGAPPRAAEHIAYLERTYRSNLVHAQRMQRTPSTRVYEDSFLQSDSPRIRAMVARLVELGMR
jgi:ectoine hydroxylase-related dioxygenase (phytanoyl-CoA dioxygenase family)